MELGKTNKKPSNDGAVSSPLLPFFDKILTPPPVAATFQLMIRFFYSLL